MREKEKSELKSVLQGAWVKGIRWFCFGTDSDIALGPEDCAHFGSLSTAYWPFQNVADIGITPGAWSALDPAPAVVSTLPVDAVKVVWIGNMGRDGGPIWHGVVYQRN